MANSKSIITPIAVKRIFNDMKDLNQDPLDKEGIYHYFNEDDITSAYIMIIGPEDTPYENGFYFFKFTFPNTYPFQPPAVKFQTLDGNIRFNPNLYTCGKVCLSLINTWEGPKWTSCQTVRSVLISLRGLVLGVKHPLQNEPGYESITDTRSIYYNNVISHENYRVAVVKMINNTPPGFEYFRPIMVDYLKQKYIWYYQRLTKLSELDGSKIISSVYSMCITTNYKGQLIEIQKILTKNGFEIPKISPDKTESILENQLEDESEITNPPSQNASKYYNGYKMVSDKDGKTYEVVSIGKGYKKKKNWVLSKEQPKSKVIEKKVKDIDTSIVKKAEVKAEAESISSLEDETVEKKGGRKAPSEPAKKYPVGHTMKSVNDGNLYIVSEYKRGSTLCKKWVKTTSNNTLKPDNLLEEPKELSKEFSKELSKEPLEKSKPALVELTEKTKEELDKSEDSKEKKRKAPNESAKIYPEGYELTSSNDNRVYVVKLVGTSEKQFKRWVLKK